MENINITVAVIYHSKYGHTQKQAEAVAAGIDSVDAANSILIRVEDIEQYWEVLNKADGIIFGAPTYMGSVSAQFKIFMDATSSNVFAKGHLWANKVAAGFTNAASRSGDKLVSLQQLTIFAAQHHMHWVNLALSSGHNTSSSTEDALNRHGFFIGAAAQSDVDVGADIAPPLSDLRTAQHLGARVANVALQLTAGRKVLDGIKRANPSI